MRWRPPAVGPLVRGILREPVAVGALCIATVRCVRVAEPVQQWVVHHAPGLLPFGAFDGRSGWAALRAEALWTASFLCVLSGLVVLLLGRLIAEARRGAENPDRPARAGTAPQRALLVAYPLLALPASLIATASVRLSGPDFDPRQRGAETERMFQTVYSWSGHALVLGLAGGIAASLAASWSFRVRTPARLSRFHAWRPALLALAEALPRRLGHSLAAAVMAVIVLRVLTSDVPTGLLRPAAAFWCRRGKDIPETCVPALSGLVETSLPFPRKTLGSGLLAQVITEYSIGTFAIVFFVAHLLVRRLLAGMPPVLRAALSAGAGYLVASNVCLAGLTVLNRIGTRHLGNPYQELSTLPGLPHALYGAPVAALLAAAAAALYQAFLSRTASWDRPPARLESVEKVDLVRR